MKTWLYTWDPKRWTRDSPLDNYTQLREKIARGERALTLCLCEGNKSLEAGDRIFFIRPGADRCGIVASGHALTPAMWTELREQSGATTKKVPMVMVNMVCIQFDKIADIDAGKLLAYDQLLSIDNSCDWSIQSAEVLIPEDTAKAIEKSWEMV